MCGLCSLASSRLHFRVQQNLCGSYAMSKLHRGLCRKSDDFSSVTTSPTVLAQIKQHRDREIMAFFSSSILHSTEKCVAQIHHNTIRGLDLIIHTFSSNYSHLSHHPTITSKTTTCLPKSTTETSHLVALVFYLKQPSIWIRVSTHRYKRREAF